MSFSKVSIWASLPRTQRGQPIVLSSDPKGEKLLYGHGNSVVIRDIKDPSKSDMYTEHSVPVTVAKWSPSGFYICSADTHGKVRIWDTINAEHVLKAEYQPLGGGIRDIAWSPDSLRLAVAGDGRGKFCHVFMLDTGASVKGDLSGHSKAINSVDWKATRPHRLATGAEDNKMALYEGPPFQFLCTKTEHQKYVQVVRFSPDGARLASGGFDGKVFLYDGKSGDIERELGGPAHRGGVYGVSWAPDSTRVLTASGDKTCKIWQVETGDLLAEYTVGNQVEDQQVSCLWTAAGHLLSLSLSGFINVLDPNQPGHIERVIKGHASPITRLALSPDSRQVYSCAMDGGVTRWELETGLGDRVEGRGHGNQVSGLVVLAAGSGGGAGKVYTAGIDDSLQVIDPVQLCYTSSTVSLGSQPRHMCPWPRPNTPDAGLALVTVSAIILVLDGRVVATVDTPYEPQCVAVSPDGAWLATGGGDNKLRVYAVEGTQVTESHTLDHLGAVTAVTFSPCSTLLGACDAYRRVCVYSTADWSPAVKAEWGFHTARINCIAFSPNGRMLATGSLDTSIIVWSVDSPSKRITIQSAHPQAQVTALAWTSDTTLLSAGHDACIRTWAITAHQ